MAIDKKILEEIKRHNNINKYIMEQGELPPPPAEAAPAIPSPEVAPAAPAAPLSASRQWRRERHH